MTLRSLVAPALALVVLAGCATDAATPATPGAADGDTDVATSAPVTEPAPDSTSTDEGSPPASADAAADASPAPTGTTVTVTATNFAFDTEEVVVPVGATIRFTVAEGTHSLTSEPAGLDTGLITGDATITLTASPGTYAFRCTLHGQMRGDLTVTG